MENVSTKPKIKHYRIIVLVVIWFLYVVNYFDKFAVLYLLPYIRTDLKLSHQMIGFAASLFFFAYWAAQLPSGLLADKFGPKRVIAIAIGVFTCFTFLTGRVYSLASFIMVRLGLGLGEGFEFVPSIRAISDWFPSKEQGRATSFFTTSWTVAPAIAAIVVTTIAAAWGWRSVFYFLAVPGIFGILALWYYVKDKPEQAYQAGKLTKEELDYIKAGQPVVHSGGVAKASFRKMLGDLQLWIISFIVFLRLFVFWGTSFWLSSFLAEQHGFKITTMGALASLPYVVGFGSQMCAGWMMDKVTKSRAKPLIIVAFAGLALILYGITLIPKGDTVLLIFALGILGFFNVFYDGPIYAFVQLRYPKDVIGSVTGITQAVGQFGSFVAPAVTGFFVTVGAKGTANFTTVFLMFVIVSVLGLILSAMLNETALKAV
ncbi:MAG: MFS transporter [Desulfobaccales bacterium]